MRWWWWQWCALLFVSVSAFPLDFPGTSHPREFLVRIPRPRRFCLPSPFLDHVGLPSALQLLSPFHSLTSGRRGCFSFPFVRTYIIKVCPKKEGTSTGENLNGTLKEIIKEVEKEKEKELLPDNANIEVKGEEVETENFVKKGNSVESKESQVEDKDMESKNKIIQVSEEIIEVSNANKPHPQQPPLDSFEKNFDENVSITSNLV